MMEGAGIKSLGMLWGGSHDVGAGGGGAGDRAEGVGEEGEEGGTPEIGTTVFSGLLEEPHVDFL